MENLQASNDVLVHLNRGATGVPDPLLGALPWNR